MKKPMVQDYYDFLNDVLMDLMSGKDPKQKIANKLEKLNDKLEKLNAPTQKYNKGIIIKNNNVIV